MRHDPVYRPITADEFLEMDFGTDKRFELHRGVIYMMAGGSEPHERKRARARQDDAKNDESKGNGKLMSCTFCFSVFRGCSNLRLRFCFNGVFFQLMHNS